MDNKKIVKCIKDNDPEPKFDARKFVTSALGYESLHKYQKELWNIFYNTTLSSAIKYDDRSITNSYTAYDTLW